MSNIVQTFRSYTPGNAPTVLLPGQFAVNIPDNLTWMGDENGVPVLIGGGCRTLAPYLRALNPKSIEVGATVDVVVDGGNFDPETELTFSNDLVVNTVVTDSDSQITANVTASEVITSLSVSAKNCDSVSFPSDLNINIIAKPSIPYITIWRTNTDGESVKPNFYSIGTYDVLVDWGDGTSDRILDPLQAEASHVYATAGDHTISITGSASAWASNFYSDCTKDKLIEVVQLGDVSDVSYNGAFWACTNLVTAKSGLCDTSNVISTAYMFQECVSLTNLDLSTMNVDSLFTSTAMIAGCVLLTDETLDITSFNGSTMTEAGGFFSDCHGLVNVDLSQWSTVNMRGVSNMFARCINLTSVDFTGWVLDGNLSNTRHMFMDCSSLVTLVPPLFTPTSPSDYNHMFTRCPLLVTCDISGWDFSSIYGMVEMFKDSNAWEDSQYDALLLTLSQQAVQPNVEMHVGDACYQASSAAARQGLIDNGWIITDGGQCPGLPVFVGTIPDITGDEGVAITPYDASVNFTEG